MAGSLRIPTYGYVRADERSFQRSTSLAAQNSFHDRDTVAAIFDVILPLPDLEALRQCLFPAFAREAQLTVFYHPSAEAQLSKLRLKPPIIEERQNSVLITVRHEPLASPEEAVMEYLESHIEIVNRIGREITGMTSENSMKRVFIKASRQRSDRTGAPSCGFAAAWRKVANPQPPQRRGRKRPAP
jgi:hypothetical protein